MRETFLLIILIVVAFQITPAPFHSVSRAESPSSVDELTASDLLRKSSAVYAGCRTYQDKGIVKTTLIKAETKRTIEKPFTTAFVRPDRFRFEYRETGRRDNHYIVWARAEDVRTWWGIKPQIRQEELLMLAVAGATGVSGGSAHTIPALLLPDRIGGFKITQMSNAERKPDEVVDGVECYRIAGQWRSHPIVLSIDKATFLLRRMDYQFTFSDSRSETTTTYQPVIDENIEESLLEFGAPSSHDRSAKQ